MVVNIIFFKKRSDRATHRQTHSFISSRLFALEGDASIQSERMKARDAVEIINKAS